MSATDFCAAAMSGTTAIMTPIINRLAVFILYYILWFSLFISLAHGLFHLLLDNGSHPQVVQPAV